jgi:diguanylate cyclase (GGDEF)-like protein
MPDAESKLAPRARLEFASVMWSVVLTIIAILVVGVGVTAIYLPVAMKAATIEAAYRSNLDVADQIKITRGYYTKNVVARAVQSGALTPSFSYKDDPKAIPLPATFVKDISELLKEKDTTLSLVSPYPWPHRAERKMDDFESTAWQAFQMDPNAVFSRQEVQDGKRVLRVAIADRMTGQTCVNCHNGHEQSARKDWKVGDVRAVMQVTKVVEPHLAAAEQHSNMIIASLSGAAAIAALALLGVACLVQRRAREKRQADLRLEYLAHHDALTGLPNRVRLREHLETALTTVSPDNIVAVLYLDLDRFKEVNDTLGHLMGDALLKRVAERLRVCVREADMIARLGGDEFAIIQKATPQPQEATALAVRIIETLTAPFDLSGTQVNVDTSIGIALWPTDGADSEQLLKNADLAVYRAKSDGRGTYRFFEAEMDQRMQERRRLEADLRLALLNGEFELHYQPLLNLESEKICGFEALLRWNHRQRGKVGPSEFIPLAEDTGLIVPIGEWVLRQACRQAASWPSHLMMAVNVSPIQFKGHNLVQLVVSALAAAGLAAQRLEIEITESVILQDGEGAFSTLTQLHELGVSIALDDFGTGYSSLSNLRKFPFDKIKIDRSFISDLSDANVDAIAVVRALARLGASLGMKTTAEGVETKQQLEHARAEGCTEIQGFYISRPVAAEEMVREFLQTKNEVATAA